MKLLNASVYKTEKRPLRDFRRGRLKQKKGLTQRGSLVVGQRAGEQQPLTDVVEVEVLGRIDEERVARVEVGRDHHLLGPLSLNERPGEGVVTGRPVAAPDGVDVGHAILDELDLRIVAAITALAEAFVAVDLDRAKAPAAADHVLAERRLEPAAADAARPVLDLDVLLVRTEHVSSDTAQSPVSAVEQPAVGDSELARLEHEELAEERAGERAVREVAEQVDHLLAPGGRALRLQRELVELLDEGLGDVREFLARTRQRPLEALVDEHGQITLAERTEVHLHLVRQHPPAVPRIVGLGIGRVHEAAGVRAPIAEAGSDPLSVGQELVGRPRTSVGEHVEELLVVPERQPAAMRVLRRQEGAGELGLLDETPHELPCPRTRPGVCSVAWPRPVDGRAVLAHEGLEQLPALLLRQEAEEVRVLGAIEAHAPPVERVSQQLAHEGSPIEVERFEERAVLLGLEDPAHDRRLRDPVVRAPGGEHGRSFRAHGRVADHVLDIRGHVVPRRPDRIVLHRGITVPDVEQRGGRELPSGDQPGESGEQRVQLKRIGLGRHRRPTLPGVVHANWLFCLGLAKIASQCDKWDEGLHGESFTVQAFTLF